MRDSSIRHRVGASLASILNSSDSLLSVKKSDVHTGDIVFVKTRNSRYEIRVLDQGNYEVSGGWFDRKGTSPAFITIAGCTWGGSTILTEVVAACGLRLEFGNRLVTSTIERITVIPYSAAN